MGDEEYLRWLKDGQDDVSRCAFATAPDVLCDAWMTLERSRPMFPKIRALGYPVALVAQNGLEDEEIPWKEFDVLFIGGDTEWKLGLEAQILAAKAKEDHGKRVHMGRVNGLRRLRYAKAIGCDTVDGNFLIYGRDRNLPILLSWLRDVNGPGGVICIMCGDRFRPVRLDAKTCGPRCRKRLEVANRRLAAESAGSAEVVPHDPQTTESDDPGKAPAVEAVLDSGPYTGSPSSR